MLDEKIRRSISPGEGFGIMKGRVADASPLNLPAGTVVVSADDHLPLTEDLWYDRFPAHLKERAPRIWWDEQAGLYQMGVGFKPLFPEHAFPLIRSIEDFAGARSLKDRMADLDAEGVAKEIVFPQVLTIFWQYPDLEVREWLFRIYNEYIAELQDLYPDRFFPVAIPNYWDPAKSAESVRHIAELGLKTLMLPGNPGKRIDGVNVFYNDPTYNPMWEAIEQSGLPLCFHVGEKFDSDGVNGEGARLMFDLGPNYFRKVFGQLVFGLVFDKYPGLRVMFAEAGIGWVANALQDAEMLYNAHAPLFDSLPEHRPSWYWHNHCYATFMADAVGLRHLDIIGTDRVMWGLDYPHNEGAFGYSHEIMQNVIDAAGPEGARKILGQNAIDLFNL